jgi:hypothetical protein
MDYKKKPTVEYVKKFVNEFAIKNYYDNENYLAAIDLTKAFFSCDNYRNIYIKVNFINGAFKTAIADTFGVSKLIYGRIKKMDQRLKAGDIKLIDEISFYKSEKGNVVRKNYSFATKFCHCHQPNLYPINDRYVRNSLYEFNKHHNFSNFKKKALLDYEVFKNVIKDFKASFGLDSLDFTTIDRFLWALGRKKDKLKRSNF